MRPYHSATDKADQIVAHTIHRSNLTLQQSVRRANGSDVSFSEFSRSLPFAASHTIWLRVCPIPIATRQTFGLCAGPAPIAASHTLGLRPAFMPIARWRVVAPLGCLVPHIVCIRAYPQVRRVATRWEITSVQDVHPVWDRSVGKTPCDAVRRVRLAIPRETPIPILSPASSPNPARIRLAYGHFRPEPFDKIIRNAMIDASHRRDLHVLS